MSPARAVGEEGKMKRFTATVGQLLLSGKLESKL